MFSLFLSLCDLFINNWYGWFRMIFFGNIDQGWHIGGKKSGREGGLEPSQYCRRLHPSIYSALVLGSWVMGSLEPFLSHRQENTLDRWPVHHRDDNHTNIHIHTRLQSVIHMSCISLDCGRNPEGTNVNMERTNTQKGLLVQLVLQYLFYKKKKIIYCFRNVRVVSAFIVIIFLF